MLRALVAGEILRRGARRLATRRRP